MTTIAPTAVDSGIAAVDLTAAQWTFVTRDAAGLIIPAIATSDNLAVLQYPAKANLAVTFIVAGKAKVFSAAVIPANTRVRSDATGKAVAALSTEPSIGWTVEPCVVGQVVEVQIDRN